MTCGHALPSLQPDPQSWANDIISVQEAGQLSAEKSGVAEEADEQPGANGFKGTTARVCGAHEAHRDPKQG